MENIDDNNIIRELENRFNQNKKTLLELQELTSQLKAVNKKLEESESLKSHFISNIRNEIINPFTSIINLSKQIVSLKGNDLNKAAFLAENIFSEAFDLDFQLKNIFAAAEIEAGEAFPQVYLVNSTSLIQNILDLNESRLKSKKLNVVFNNTIDKDFTFKTDPEKLNLIISNIFNNAINFSKESNTIEVKAEIINNQLAIKVKDNGIGIDSEQQKIIFDRFKRIDNCINTLNKGHGLGLSVAYAFVDVLNGTIEVESELNVGSEFTITIPKTNDDIEAKGVAFDDNELFF